MVPVTSWLPQDMISSCLNSLFLDWCEHRANSAHYSEIPSLNLGAEEHNLSHLVGLIPIPSLVQIQINLGALCDTKFHHGVL